MSEDQTFEVVVIGGKTVEAIRADVEQHLTGALADKFDEPDHMIDAALDAALDAANL